MRSELVFGAMEQVSNRFLLTKLASKATRKFHRPNTRIQETANEVFERFGRSSPISKVRYISRAEQPFRCVAQAKRGSLCLEPTHIFDDRDTTDAIGTDFWRVLTDEMLGLYQLSFR